MFTSIFPRKTKKTIGTYEILKSSFSVMPSRLVPMAITSRVRPENTWMGRYRTRIHDDTTGNRKNNRPSTHWEEEEEHSKFWFTLEATKRHMVERQRFTPDTPRCAQRFSSTVTENPKNPANFSKLGISKKKHNA